jgi:hypothetical protein
MSGARSGPGPLNLTWDEKRMLIACIQMWDENVSMDQQDEAEIEAFESLKSKVNA